MPPQVDITTPADITTKNGGIHNNVYKNIKQSLYQEIARKSRDNWRELAVL
jgi:hypothetical protein